MIAVTFLKAAGIYNAGETAGFDADTAAQLVKDGVAEFFAPVDTEDEPKTSSLASLKLDELKALAVSEGIELGEAAKKAEIVELIESALLAKEIAKIATGA